MSEFFALENPLLWVTLSFVAIVAVFGRKIARAAGVALDKRSEKIDSDLQQAAALRAEAEALLADYTQKSLASVREAESIVASARAQATAMIVNAEAELKASMEKRIEQMNKRLQDEEKAALAQVRNHVVDITIAAAKSLVADHFKTMSGDEMVRFVVSDFDRRVH